MAGVEIALGMRGIGIGGNTGSACGVSSDKESALSWRAGG